MNVSTFLLYCFLHQKNNIFLVSSISKKKVIKNQSKIVISDICNAQRI